MSTKKNTTSAATVAAYIPESVATATAEAQRKGQIAKGRIKMIGAHRRGRSWDMLIERMEIAEEGGEA